jgi:hypothetical protein
VATGPMGEYVEYGCFDRAFSTILVTTMVVGMAVGLVRSKLMHMEVSAWLCVPMCSNVFGVGARRCCCFWAPRSRRGP